MRHSVGMDINTLLFGWIAGGARCQQTTHQLSIVLLTNGHLIEKGWTSSANIDDDPSVYPTPFTHLFQRRCDQRKTTLIYQIYLQKASTTRQLSDVLRSHDLQRR
ncbi:hypothetical protein HCH54_003981 [Aspergillus fumigatus]